MNRQFTLKKLSKNPLKAKKRYSHRKTLGAYPIPPSGTITNYKVPITDQGPVNDCTAFTVKEIVQAFLGWVIDAVVFFKAEISLGGSENGCTLETQGAAAVKVGLTKEGESQPSIKASYYLFIQPSFVGGPDWFDLLRSVIVARGPLSGGLDFRYSWQDAPGGIIPHDLTPIERGHDVTLANLNYINGVDYIDISVHWGPGVGDGGIYHLDRYMTNGVFDNYGVIELVFGETDINIQRMGLLEALLVNLKNLLNKLSLSLANALGFPKE